MQKTRLILQIQAYSFYLHADIFHDKDLHY